MKIYPVSFTLIDTASSSDVCLEKYITLSDKSCKDISKVKKAANFKPKSLSDKTTDSPQLGGEKTDNISDNNFQTVVEKTNCIAVSSQIVTEKTNNITEHNTQGENSSNVDGNINEQCDFLNGMLDLCHRTNVNSDDNSYINVLTPPKSVPELDQTLEPYFNEIQRPFSSLPSLKDTSINLPTLHSENLDIFSGEIDFDPLLNSTSSKSSQFFNVTEETNQVNNDIIPDSDITDSNLENILTLNNPLSVVSSVGKDVLCENTEKDKNLNENIENKNTSDDEEEEEGEGEEEDIYSKTVKEGWTVDEAGYLTFGELYLMVCIFF